MAPPPTLPILSDAVSLGLSHAGLEMGEEADIFRRNPVPENYDNLLEAIQTAKRMIASAEEQWGLTL